MENGEIKMDSGETLCATSLRHIFMLFWVLALGMACADESGNRGAVKVELQSSAWLFDFTQMGLGRLSSQVRQADFNVPDAADAMENGFTIRFSVDLEAFDRDETILEISQVLNVRLRQHDATNRRRQNYPAFKMPDGSVPVLEASIALQLPIGKREIENMTIGIPLAMLDEPSGKHEVILNFSGISWTMYIDGKLCDNDFTLGYPVWNDRCSWTLNPAYVGMAEIFFPALTPQRISTPEPETDHEIQYWTPRGHNTWVGDVATCFHNGRYHVFYLYDRRHHASKFGRGAHYFEHLSTADFKTWIEHEPATPIEEQWETFGTGTPFVFDGKLYISYGLHTTRIYPKEQTTLPEQWAFLEKHGYTGAFHRDSTTGFPAGSSYSVSADGVSQFKKSGVLFHPCENPSIYIDPEGKLKMLANYASKGIWESATIEGGWHCIDSIFPPGGDCTFYFRWGNFDYIIGGFINLWSKPANEPDVKYTDVVQQGLDFYNGLNVPAITEIPGGRFLMAGWMGIRGWGGPLIIHEMIQFQDGRIGTKWMEEITPETGKPVKLASKLTENETTTTFLTEHESFLLTFRVRPVKKGARFGIVFLNENNEQNACEWQVRPDAMQAQFAQGSLTGFSESEKSLRQGGNPQSGNNYAIENLIEVDKPFTVRLLVKGSDKLGGTLIDAEIAGCRTMIAYRPDLFVTNMLFRTEGIELEEICISPIINHN